MIKINNLTKKYKEKYAVNNLNLEIKSGELFSLLGTNGAGKTTTIKMLSTLILPTSGEVKINNFDLTKDSAKIKEIINISPQETAIAPNLTVIENLYFMAGIYQIKNKKKKIEELISLFKLSIKVSNFCSFISYIVIGFFKIKLFFKLLHLINLVLTIFFIFLLSLIL